MQTAAAYIRVSTEEQTEFSPDAQLRAIKKYCEANSYVLPPEHIYIDEGKSGRKAEKRPAFMKMIAAAKKKPEPFNAILVHRFDRFARNRQDSVVYKALLSREHGIKVISVTEAVGDDKMSVIIEAMLEAMAEYYSVNLSEEVKKGMTEKAERGGVLSVPAFGYKISDGNYTVVPEEAEIVRKVFDDFILGKPMLKIAKEINLCGVRTHRGNPFENRTVDYILHNPIYIGKTRWNPTGKTRRDFGADGLIVASGHHEAIIDEEIYLKAQNRLEEIKRTYRPYYKPRSEKSHWLVGLVRCPDCGGAMVNSNGYMKCNNYSRGACKVSNSINTKNLAELFLSAVLKSVDMCTEVIVPEDSVQTKKAATIMEKTTAAENRFTRVREAYIDGVDTLEEYKANKQAISEEIAFLRRQLLNITAESHGGYQVNLKEYFNEISADSSKLHSLIRKIVKDSSYSKARQRLEITFFYSKLQ